MKKHIYDEQNGLRYTLHGDVYLPDLAVSGNEHKPLGKYGLMRRTYLREHYNLSYNEERYHVFYDPLASNLMPTIKVAERGGKMDK